MDWSFSRRTWLQGTALVGGVIANASEAEALHHSPLPGCVSGRMSGAMAIVESLVQEGVECVYGIPGAQENELWDAMKSRGLPYLLVTHEFSAACMADGYARCTGKPGVLCVVPGPGVTNSLTGLGEALIDSVPIVCIVGDIAQGDKYRPFQVHCLDQVGLLKSVTKCVLNVTDVSQIASAVRQAFALASAGEPGPVAVVVPYTMLIETHTYASTPPMVVGQPFDETAFLQAMKLLSDRKLRIGIYAGQGCQDYSDALVCLAETLQAPVATSVSGKGVIPETHPLSVGWGYGPQGTPTAERIFKGKPIRDGYPGVDCVLAIGVRYSEVSTGFYANPQTKHVIHVDSNCQNLGRVMRTDVCVHADAGLFLAKTKMWTPNLRRAPDGKLLAAIRESKLDSCRVYAEATSKCACDPMAFILGLRKCLPEDGMLFVDVTVSEHLAAEAFRVCRPRTYFNPTDNQAMGWSIPAAIGAQRVRPNRTVATLTGDGCFLMTAMEVSTAARECIPVKFFILDDQAYHYMQMLQNSAYLRTTATILAKLSYPDLAKGLGVAYQEIRQTDQIEAGIRGAFQHPGPVLTRVLVDYRDLKVRWIEAVRGRYVKELNAAQKTRFLARMGSRALDFQKQND